MEIKISVSNEESFKKNYSEIIDDNMSISEDDVGYGLEQSITVGLLFIWDCAVSGITWDIIKESIKGIILKFEAKRRPQDNIKYSFKKIQKIGDNKSETKYEINVYKKNKEIKVEFSDGMKVEIK